MEYEKIEEKDGVNYPNVENTTASETEKSKTFLYVGLVSFVVALLLVASLFFIFNTVQKEDDLPIGESIYGESAASRLGENNKLYQDAQFAYETRDYDKATQLYEDALSIATNPDERGQIKYELAGLKDRNEKEREAVQLFKEVSSDESVSDVIRASAVENMARKFYSKNDPVIFEEIFSTDPYRDLLVENDIKASINNIFMYASSIYPLAYSELRVADWYVSDLIANEGVSSTGESAEEVKRQIQERVANADLDNERVVKAYPNTSRFGTYLVRKAVVAGKLEQLGDPFLGDPQVLFEAALSRAAIFNSGETISFMMYNFATFLAHNRIENQKDDVVALLQNFYGNGRYTIDEFEGNSFFEFLENEQNNVAGTRSDIELLASIDPNFKTMLADKLGWVF